LFVVEHIIMDNATMSPQSDNAVFVILRPCVVVMAMLVFEVLANPLHRFSAGELLGLNPGGVQMFPTDN
jgi:hypothetical protein